MTTNYRTLLYCHRVYNKRLRGNTAPATLQLQSDTAGFLIVPDDGDGSQRPPIRDFGSRQRIDGEMIEGGSN